MNKKKRGNKKKKKKLVYYLYLLEKEESWVTVTPDAVLFVCCSSMKTMKGALLQVKKEKRLGDTAAAVDS